ncbi:ArnT family glycosyltransferase [Larsenimonas rhizosphaerae]|uniref:ArnT family glycosyltransferase n=1 Tax=Larsenimonas rhizosphaerae TaxID=2944682 RepID=UPI002034094A|nr:glycosyltransferase family 39 protein [Larsenimonas rhizosphaerae]MCM2131340.1 glycosyltransferase family 39 protein [Larsenimonas rhizosphaerae]
MALPPHLPPTRLSHRRRTHYDLLILSLLWLVLAASALMRPLLPIDETRYVSVAWEMWQGHHFWVPLMNGAPYADKPPLLFWLIHAGWAVFGVNDWWPRLISPLASLVGLVQIYRIARGLDYAPEHARLAPLVLMTMLLWQLYSGALMFDVLLSACLLGAIATLIRGAFDTRRIMVCGLWVGLALLAKGPVALVTLAPVLLSSPWWRAVPFTRAEWRRVLGALGLGVVMLLGWALVAAWLGGGEFARMLLWGQTVDRLHNSMAHARPMWWYLPWLVLLMFPWTLWPSARPGLPRQRRQRLSWCWVLPPLVVFSLISGKQVHYLMPLLPGVALMIMDRLAQQPERAAGSKRPVALAIAALGAVALGALLFGVGAVDTTLILPFGAVLLLGIGVLLWWLPVRSLFDTARTLAIVSTLALVVVLQVVLSPLWHRNSVTGPGQLIGTLQRDGIPVAFVGGDYQATFQFAGRLKAPLIELSSDEALCRFRSTSPEGWVVGRARDEAFRDATASARMHRYAYRSGTLLILPVSGVRASTVCP